MFPLPFSARIVLLLVVVAVIFGAGWTVRGWKADAEQTALLRAHEQAVTAALEKDKAQHSKLASELAEAQKQRETDTEWFTEKLRHAKPNSLVRVECPQQPAGAVELVTVPMPREPPADTRVVFTGEFVGLWNDALAIGAPEAERAGRPDATTERAGVVEAADLLANLGQNGRRLNECGAQVSGWQTWACENGFAGGDLCRKP